MQVYLSDLSKHMRPFSRRKVISCEYEVSLMPPCWFTNICSIFKKQYIRKQYPSQLVI